MLAHAPRFTPSDAERIAREHFGAPGAATPLPSERDQNFLINGEPRVVLKIANATEPRAMLEAQQAALDHAAARGARVPRVVRSAGSGPLVDVRGNGVGHLAWAVSWIDGVPLAQTRWRSPQLLRDLGHQV